MRKITRSATFKKAVTGIAAAYLAFCFRTTRWTRVNHEAAQGVWASETGAIFAFWHSRGPIAAAAWELRNGAQPLSALISTSSDGEIMSQTMARLGISSIRGSRRSEYAIEDKGGAGAFRAMLRWMKDGGAVAISPDGPKGPLRDMGDGTPSLARISGAPVLLLGIACNPCIRTKSWDQTVFPLPFARGAMVWDGPVHADRDADLQAIRQEWGARLTAVTEQAEALVK